MTLLVDLFAVTLAAAPQAPAAVPLQPIAIADAIDAFGEACIKSFPNPQRFRRAIAQLPAGYTQAPGGTEWRSSRAVVSYVANGDGVAPQCALDALLDTAPEDTVLIGQVQSRMREYLGPPPRPYRSGDTVFWSWTEDARNYRLILDLGAAKRRQFSLALQRLK